jgi:hypothetical protein
MCRPTKGAVIVDASVPAFLANQNLRLFAELSSMLTVSPSSSAIVAA